MGGERGREGSAGEAIEGPVDEGESEVPGSGGFEVLTAALEEAPRRHLDVDYLVSCTLPGEDCGLIVERVDSIMEVTRTNIELEPEDHDGMRRLTITGFLPYVYTAHLRLMSAYHHGVEEKEQA